MRKYSSIQNIQRKFVPFLLATQFGQQMALASRMEYLFSTVGSHLPMEHILFARVVLIRQCCLSFAKKAFICRKKSHLPISPRICRLHIICQRVVSFPDFNSHLPFDIICQRIVSHFPTESLICHFQLSHFPNHLPHLPKGGEKISLTPPNGYPEQEKETVGLYTIHIDSLLFFL